MEKYLLLKEKFLKLKNKASYFCDFYKIIKKKRIFILC